MGTLFPEGSRYGTKRVPRCTFFSKSAEYLKNMAQIAQKRALKKPYRVSRALIRALDPRRQDFGFCAVSACAHVIFCAPPPPPPIKILAPPLVRRYSPLFTKTNLYRNHFDDVSIQQRFNVTWNQHDAQLKV